MHDKHDCDTAGLVVVVPHELASVQVLVCVLPEQVVHALHVQLSTQAMHAHVVVLHVPVPQSELTAQVAPHAFFTHL